MPNGPCLGGTRILGLPNGPCLDGKGPRIPGLPNGPSLDGKGSRIPGLPNGPSLDGKGSRIRGLPNGPCLVTPKGDSSPEKKRGAAFVKSGRLYFLHIMVYKEQAIRDNIKILGHVVCPFVCKSVCIRSYFVLLFPHFRPTPFSR